MKLFNQPQDPESRVAALRGALSAAEAERAAARDALGAIVASGEEGPELVAARERVAIAAARFDELTAALPVAEARVVEAREQAATTEREQHLARAQHAALERQRHAQRFDEAVGSLNEAWAAYETAAIEEQQALRAAGQQSGPVVQTLRRRAVSALWCGARPLARLLQLPYPHRMEPLATPGAPPADAPPEEVPSPAVA